MHGTIRFCMSIPMEGTSKKRGRKQRPSPKRILHFLLQNLRDEFAHPLPQPLLQTLPPGIPLLLVRARCRATVRHGVSSCGRDLQQRDPGFVFNDFSGAYAFHFSTGIGTEPRNRDRTGYPTATHARPLRYSIFYSWHEHSLYRTLSLRCADVPYRFASRLNSASHLNASPKAATHSP